MSRRKELRYMTLGIQDGSGGTAAVNDSSVSASDTTIEIDTVSLNDSRTTISVGNRFTTAGISTIRTVTAANNSQRWTLTIDATGGTFKLTLNGQTTSAIAFDATSAAVQSALEALSSVTAGDVVVAGDGPHTITMAGDLANVSTNTLTSNAASLTGGASTATLAVVHNGTTTWQLTFTPAIASGSVPSDNDVITVMPIRVEMKIGEGNLSWTENDDPIVDLDRGLIDGMRNGNEQPMEVNASFIFDWLRASTGGAITVYEALKRVGGAANFLSTAVCEAYQVDIFVIDRPNCGSEQAEMMFFRNFRARTISPDVESGLVSFSGICASTAPEVYRVANTDYGVGAQN